MGDQNATGRALSAEPGDLSAERILLLLPGGPLLVEFTITIDGLPFRTPREDLVSEMLEAADRDGDGRPTWGEVFADPKRIFGHSSIEQLKMSSRKEFMKANDTNRNGLLDRDEARRFIGQMKSSSASFLLKCESEHRLTPARQSIVWNFLDVDHDGALDRAELAGLEQHLLVRDANDDRIVTWFELDDSLAGDELATARRNAIGRDDALALLLGSSANWGRIGDVLGRTYLEGRSVPPAPSLLRRLDANDDGDLSSEELRALDVIEPHLVVSASFGHVEGTVPGVSLSRYSPQAGSTRAPISQTQDVAVFVSSGCRLRFLMEDRLTVNDRWPSAEAQMAELDTDKNGYLQRPEVAAVADAKLFEEADTNADGKLYLDELAAYRQRRRAPQLSAVYALVRDDPDFVFSVLDANHDMRLTPRELLGGAAALCELDLSSDGRVSLEEIPAAVHVVLGRGGPPELASPAQAVPVAKNEEGLPKWFRPMDTNGDGEIGREEFPGSSEKFRLLDLDGDGFIVASEVNRADAAVDP